MAGHRLHPRVECAFWCVSPSSSIRQNIQIRWTEDYFRLYCGHRENVRNYFASWERILSLLSWRSSHHRRPNVRHSDRQARRGAKSMEEGSSFREFLRVAGRVPAATVIIPFRARQMRRLRFHVVSRDCKHWLASRSRPSDLKHFI